MRAMPAGLLSAAGVRPCGLERVTVCPFGRRVGLGRVVRGGHAWPHCSGRPVSGAGSPPALLGAGCPLRRAAVCPFGRRPGCCPLSEPGCVLLGPGRLLGWDAACRRGVAALVDRDCLSGQGTARPLGLLPASAGPAPRPGRRLPLGCGPPSAGARAWNPA